MNKFQKSFTPTRKVMPIERYRKNIGEFNHKVAKKVEVAESKQTQSTQLKEGVEIIKLAAYTLLICFVVMISYLIYTNL